MEGAHAQGRRGLSRGADARAASLAPRTRAVHARSMDARGTPPQGPPGEGSPWPHRAAQQGQPAGRPGSGPPPSPQPPPSPAYGAPQPQQPDPPASLPAPPTSPAYGPPTGTIPQQRHPHPHQQQPSAPRPPRRAADGRTTLTRVLRAWWAGRIRRLVPRGVPWTAVAFAVVLLAAWVLFADILVTPGVVMTFPGEAPSRDWAHDVIGWVAMLLTFGLGSAAALLLLQLHGARARWAALGVPVASTLLTLWMVATGPGQPLQWIVGIVGCGLASLALAVVAALLAVPRVHLSTAAAMLLAVQWGLVLWVGAIEPTGWVFLSAWTNLAFPVVLVIAVIAILAVALYAQQVHARADRIGRRILLAGWVPIVAAALALALVVLRMGPLRMLFNELDANLWDWRSATSWVHAAVAGSLIVWVVARSGTRPLRSRGNMLVVLGLAAMAGMPLLSFLVTFVALSFTEDGSGGGMVEWLGDLLLLNNNLAGLYVGIALVLIASLPWSRRSTGRVGALVALVVAVPTQVWLLATQELGYGGERFIAGPGQISLVILVIVLALAIWGAARRRDVVDRHLLLRLAVLPVLILHAGQLLPGFWRDDFEQVQVVLLSLLGLLLLGAPRTGTKEGDARALVAPFAVQMALLGSVIVVRTMGQDVDATTTAISVLYLTMPVAAMLSCRLEDPSDAWARGATTTIDLQTMRRASTPVPVVLPVDGWGGAPIGPMPQPWGAQHGPGPRSAGSPPPWQPQPQPHPQPQPPHR